MNILHLSSGYSKQSIYRDLVCEIEKNDTGMIGRLDVFVPVRSKEELNKYPVVDSPTIKVKQELILDKFDRIFYFRKINKVLKTLKSSHNLESYDVVHAHFLFSDGGVAYKLKREYGTPYIVAVRNTDVNFFLKYGIHLRRFGKKILSDAEHIIFVTPSYVQELKEYVGTDFFNSIRDKIKIIPNGLVKGWFGNPPVKDFVDKQNLKFLYVGDFSKNKNIPWLVASVLKLNPNSTIDIIGSNGADSDRVKELADMNKNIHLIGRVTDKWKLKEAYRKSDVLCVLSKRETFGLVYIEALSQGTPILYTQGQGVDGYFSKVVGYPIKFQDFLDFKSKIELLKSNYDELAYNAQHEVKQFRWSTIAKTYLNIYKEICQKS